MVLSGLFSVGAMNIEGFASGSNVKSMLLFASFLGLASVGQTLVALLGGLDLSIPFVIGAANVGLLYLIGARGATLARDAHRAGDRHDPRRRSTGSSATVCKVRR